MAKGIKFDVSYVYNIRGYDKALLPLPDPPFDDDVTSFLASPFALPFPLGLEQLPKMLAASPRIPSLRPTGRSTIRSRRIRPARRRCHKSRS
jgi:hypothetical protein